MSNEAMKLAVEALQLCTNAGMIPMYLDANKAAIKALEEALAKQEHPIERNFCERCGKRAFDGIHTCTPPAKQEQREQDEFLLRGVLASELKCWHRLTADESQNLIDFVKNMGAKQEQGVPVGVGGYLTTTSSQQRTWVGLDEEDDIDWEEGGSLRDLVEAIEAKLKEKNT
jgi:hypothetical protein